MQNAARTNRVLIDFSFEREFADSGIAVSKSRFFQHAVVRRLAYGANSREAFTWLAQSLIRLAEHSFSIRDIDTLEQTSLMLANLPTTWANQIGRYYQAIALSRVGQTDQALSQLEGVADNAPLVYRNRALQTMGSIYHRQGCHDEALRFYSEASRFASRENGRDLLTGLMVELAVSCIASEMGDHRGALSGYERLSPLVQIVGQQNPLYFYFYHNDLAVEFAELGRLAEAEAACAIALASPFAPAYPEWSETRDEIAAKRRSASPSVVAIHRVPEAKPIHEVERPPGADLATEPESQRKAVLFRNLTFNSLASNTDFFQRPSVTIPARAITAPCAMGILDRVLICIGPRAPPIHS